MFWPPRSDATEYIALATEVGRAFHTLLPGERLIGPATAGIDFDFLEACFKADLETSWSAISVHPYRQNDPGTAATEYARLRELIKSHQSEGGAIISSEWGYSAAWSHMNEESQAVMLTREFLTNVANGIQISIWYDWRDDGDDPNEPEDHFGLVRNAYRSGQTQAYDPKPAYLAAQTLAKVLGGYRFQERLSVGSADDYLLVFVKDSERRFVAWTSSPGGRQVTIDKIANNLASQYSVVTAQGENAAGIGPTSGALNLELTPAPKYLIPIH